MKRYEFHSALAPEEVLARLRGKTRRWTRLDGWTSRSTWFLRERQKEALCLIRTGRARSYVYADLTLTGAENGTDITAFVGVSKTLYAGDIAATLLVVFLILDSIFLNENWMETVKTVLLYGWLPLVLMWTGGFTRREIPELVMFIERNLLK